MARELGRVMTRNESATLWVDYLASDLEDRAPASEFDAIDRYASARAAAARFELARDLFRFVSDSASASAHSGKKSGGDAAESAVVDASPALLRRFDATLSPVDWAAFSDEIVRVDSAIATMQADLHNAVALARSSGLGWSAIGSALGIDGEAARYRFGRRKR